MKKTLTTTLLAIFVCACMVFGFASCKKECEHAYDNACDVTCNECGEERITTHDYAVADCITPKTCKTCGVTDGNALGHNPAEDDGDCTSSILCTACGAKTTSAKSRHTLTADDGDCSTPVICAECDAHVVYAKTHDFEGAEYRSNETHHWRVCENYGCNVVGAKESHDKGGDGKCTVCEYIVEVISSHEHTYTVADYNDTHHYLRCDCGMIDETTKVGHTATSDNDCTTPDKCTCGYIVTAGTDHVAGEDDGNCMTLVKCENCDQQAKSGTTDHTDADHDYTCDNPGCQVSVGAPQDE